MGMVILFDKVQLDKFKHFTKILSPKIIANFFTQNIGLKKSFLLNY